jgi:dihydrolipoamide dehydrogenase
VSGLGGLLKANGVNVIQGRGRFASANVLDVEGSESVTFKHAVIASGSRPLHPPIEGIDHPRCLDSTGLLAIDHVPQRLIVIGGGVIGCEFASMFSDLGVQVTVLEAMDTLLPECDRDIVGWLARSHRKRGVAVHTGVRVKGHSRNGSTTTVSFDTETVTVDAVVVAAGRRPLTVGVLAEGTGVTVDSRGFVVVDDYMRTTAEGVWAVGDVVDSPQLAHVGFAEGILTVRAILGEPVVPVDYSRVPWCIYSHPEVAYAGLTEAAARQRGFDVAVQKYPLGGNSRARIIGDFEGLVKIVTERQADDRTGPILGVHMVGPWVTEVLGQGYLAVNTETVPDDIARFIQPHPTLSESFGETVLALTGRGLHLG